MIARDTVEREIEEGDLRSSGAVLAAVASSEPALLAWAHGMRVRLYLADPSRFELPVVAEFHALAAQTASADRTRAREVGRALALRARVELLLGDLGNARSLLESFRGHPGPELELVRAICHAMEGNASQSDLACLDLVAERARDERRRSLLVDATTARGLIRSELGDAEGGLELARTASRMAGTERRPQCEYFANLVLARLRRLTGMPQRASLILNSLASHATSPWQGWLSYELVLAGGRTTGAEPSPFAEIADTVRQYMSALAGKEARAIAALKARLTRAASFGLVRDDISSLIALTGGSAVDKITDDATRAWATGELDHAPRGLFALASSGPNSSGHARSAGYVFASTDDPARRILEPAVGNLDEIVVRLECPTRSAERLDTCTSVMALAGVVGIGERQLVERVYGFEYKERLHRASIVALTHRVRQRLAGLADVELRQGMHHLKVRRAFVVPDPRCKKPTDERLLSHLALHRPATARQLASRLGLPLRTIQRTLKSLVEEGECSRERLANDVVYAVEDSVFSKPALFLADSV